ncbi:hypothetical protein B0H11DRAFT_1946338 [Mycena galericulata]|nr:hypothetical protein B0H11DRAFT_1946338 [Mycena galericulata]
MLLVLLLPSSAAYIAPASASSASHASGQTASQLIVEQAREKRKTCHAFGIVRQPVASRPDRDRDRDTDHGGVGARMEEVRARGPVVSVRKVDGGEQGAVRQAAQRARVAYQDPGDLPAVGGMRSEAGGGSELKRSVKLGARSVSRGVGIVRAPRWTGLLSTVQMRDIPEEETTGTEKRISLGQQTKRASCSYRFTGWEKNVECRHEENAHHKGEVKCVSLAAAHGRYCTLVSKADYNHHWSRRARAGQWLSKYYKIAKGQGLTTSFPSFAFQRIVGLCTSIETVVAEDKEEIHSVHGLLGIRKTRWSQIMYGMWGRKQTDYYSESQQWGYTKADDGTPAVHNEERRRKVVRADGRTEEKWFVFGVWSSL